MPTHHQGATGHHLPLPPVTDAEITLSDGSRLTITGDVPASPTERRKQLQGAALYVIAGMLAPHVTGQPDGSTPTYTAAYAGRSQAMRRVERSYRYWVEALHAIEVAGLATIHTPAKWALPYLAHVEAMLIQTLSTAAYAPGYAHQRHDVCMTNTQSAALWAAAQLTTQQIHAGERFAAEAAHHVWTRILDRRVNDWPSPSGNARELAVRVIHHEATQRALDADDIVEHLHAIGYQPDARSQHRTVVRDCGQRDRLGGTSRFHARTLTGVPGARPGVRVYWNPDLPARDAIAGYIDAQRHRPWRRRRVPEAHLPARSRPTIHALSAAIARPTPPESAIA